MALILTFGPISGAHFNPAVTIADAFQRALSWRNVPLITAQLIGAVVGVLTAHLMFGLELFQFSQHVRAGRAQLFSEFVATFGLLAVIWGCSRARSESVPLAVGLYITGAYWFTASTSFANPAITAARALTNTCAGIRPADAPARRWPSKAYSANRFVPGVTRETAYAASTSRGVRPWSFTSSSRSDAVAAAAPMCRLDARMKAPRADRECAGTLISRGA